MDFSSKGLGISFFYQSGIQDNVKLYNKLNQNFERAKNNKDIFDYRIFDLLGKNGFVILSIIQDFTILSEINNNINDITTSRHYFTYPYSEYENKEGNHKEYIKKLTLEIIKKFSDEKYSLLTISFLKISEHFKNIKIKIIHKISDIYNEFRKKFPNFDYIPAISAGTSDIMLLIFSNDYQRNKEIIAQIRCIEEKYKVQENNDIIKKGKHPILQTSYSIPCYDHNCLLYLKDTSRKDQYIKYWNNIEENCKTIPVIYLRIHPGAYRMIRERLSDYFKKYASDFSIEIKALLGKNDMQIFFRKGVKSSKEPSIYLLKKFLIIIYKFKQYLNRLPLKELILNYEIEILLENDLETCDIEEHKKNIDAHTEAIKEIDNVIEIIRNLNNELAPYHIQFVTNSTILALINLKNALQNSFTSFHICDIIPIVSSLKDEINKICRIYKKDKESKDNLIYSKDIKLSLFDKLSEIFERYIHVILNIYNIRYAFSFSYTESLSYFEVRSDASIDNLIKSGQKMLKACLPAKKLKSAFFDYDFLIDIHHRSEPQITTLERLGKISLNRTDFAKNIETICIAAFHEKTHFYYSKHIDTIIPVYQHICMSTIGENYIADDEKLNKVKIKAEEYLKSKKNRQSINNEIINNIESFYNHQKIGNNFQILNFVRHISDLQVSSPVENENKIKSFIKSVNNYNCESFNLRLVLSNKQNILHKEQIDFNATLQDIICDLIALNDCSNISDDSRRGEYWLQLLYYVLMSRLKYVQGDDALHLLARLIIIVELKGDPSEINCFFISTSEGEICVDLLRDENDSLIKAKIFLFNSMINLKNNFNELSERYSSEIMRTRYDKIRFLFPEVYESQEQMKINISDSRNWDTIKQRNAQIINSIKSNENYTKLFNIVYSINISKNTIKTLTNIIYNTYILKNTTPSMDIGLFVDSDIETIFQTGIGNATGFYLELYKLIKQKRWLIRMKKDEIKRLKSRLRENISKIERLELDLDNDISELFYLRIKTLNYYYLKPD